MGSSPHTRGAQSSAMMSSRVREDHPRIRGEHASWRPSNPAHWGSSPHTRGAPIRASRPRPSTRDHPRIRGEHSTYKIGTLKAAGSSPHTRGARRGYWFRRHRRRIIPAYAGSTLCARVSVSLAKDHPRIRGEHWAAQLMTDLMPGSSPHTRGAQPRPFGGIEVRGIIPAYAGSTRPALPSARGRPDHPRIRGEHSASTTISSTISGSSPHTRGAPPQLVDEPSRTRIIPAYAGSTASFGRYRVSPSDHPRIRGEHRASIASVHLMGGSSPHTRGAQQARHEKELIPRIIPAYAGSTAPFAVG